MLPSLLLELLSSLNGTSGRTRPCRLGKLGSFLILGGLGTLGRALVATLALGSTLELGTVGRALGCFTVFNGFME